MNKEQQDKRWNRLSEREQAGWLENYKCNKEDGYKESMKIIEELFGSHNLKPKPQIPKTWEDLIDNEKFEEIDSTYVELEDFLINKDMDNKLRNKILATYQIQQLIDLSYGGMVSEEEWEDDEIKKYVVKWCASDKHPYNDWETRRKYFIAFHTPEQREEFMSYESNRKLVEQYYMM